MLGVSIVITRPKRQKRLFAVWYFLRFLCCSVDRNFACFPARRPQECLPHWTKHKFEHFGTEITFAGIGKVTLYNTFLFIIIAVKIRSSKLQQLIHGTPSPSLSCRIRPAQLSKRLYLLVLLHIFCVNKSSSHSICNLLGYKTKREAAIPLGPHIITCCFSCFSYASTNINARQWYQATPVAKKVRHDSRVGFSTFLTAVCRASLIVIDIFL
jgi:hypothetical protein